MVADIYHNNFILHCYELNWVPKLRAWHSRSLRFNCKKKKEKKASFIWIDSKEMPKVSLISTFSGDLTVTLSTRDKLLTCLICKKKDSLMKRFKCDNCRAHHNSNSSFIELRNTYESHQLPFWSYIQCGKIIEVLGGGEVIENANQKK